MKTFYNFLLEQPEESPAADASSASPAGDLGAGSSSIGGPGEGLGGPGGGLGGLSGGLGGLSGGLGGPPGGSPSGGLGDTGPNIDPNAQNQPVNLKKIKSYNVWDSLLNYLNKKSN